VPVVHAAGPRPARHLVVGRVRLEGQVRGGGDALQVAAGAVGLRVLADEFPEVGAVPGDEQVHEFVDEDVVDDPGGHAAQAGGQPDGAVVGRARPPAGALVGDPADADGVGAAVEVAPGQFTGPRLQVGVGGAPATLPLPEPLEDGGDPLLLLGLAEPGRNHHHHLVAVTVGGHGSPASGASADLNVRGHD